MNYLLILFLLTFGVNCFGDEIEAIDSNTIQIIKEVPPPEIMPVDDAKKMIEDLKIHKNKLERQEESYAALIVEDEDKIASLEKSVNDAAQMASNP